jgi:hypothetical protein
MQKAERPGAHHSDRAGEIVLGGTLPHSTGHTDAQRRRADASRIIGWRVTRWLGVEAVEVSNG